jgi:hypothetical protein
MGDVDDWVRLASRCFQAIIVRAPAGRLGFAVAVLPQQPQIFLEIILLWK